MSQNPQPLSPAAAPAVLPGRTDAPFVYFGGADQELGNFIEGTDFADTCSPAAAAVLAEIDGVPQHATATAYSPSQYAAALLDANRSLDSSARINPVDTGRKFLPTNSSCIYLDMGHLEIALPEFTRARDFVAYWHAGLRTVGAALARANVRLPRGQRIHVLVNSSDGLGNSFGQHLNFAIPRWAFDDLFHHHIQNALFLAAYQVSAIIFTGLGKVGVENGAEPATFQLSARADFFETIFGHHTTHPRRPLLNLRDQPLCGSHDTAPNEPARLHVICFDANIAQGACFLKFGVMQIILDLICAGHADTTLILDDPVQAFHTISRDLSFTQRLATLQGERLTVLELQTRFFELARRFVDAGQCRVPEADRIVALWGHTLERLKARDLAALTGRIDWVLKLSLLQNALKNRSELTFKSPAIKYLDHLYGSLDVDRGLFWSFQREGRIEEYVAPGEIERAGENPPEDTRAWTRAMLLRRAARGQVDGMDWDYIRFKFREPSVHCRTLDMSAPLALRRIDVEDRIAGAGSLAQCLDRLGVPAADAPSCSYSGGSWNTTTAIDTYHAYTYRPYGSES